MNGLSSDKPCEAARLRLGAEPTGGLAFVDAMPAGCADPGAARLFIDAAEPAASALDDVGGTLADVSDNANGLEADGRACAIPATLACEGIEVAVTDCLLSD